VCSSVSLLIASWLIYRIGLDGLTCVLNGSRLKHSKTAVLANIELHQICQYQHAMLQFWQSDGGRTIGFKPNLNSVFLNFEWVVLSEAQLIWAAEPGFDPIVLYLFYFFTSTGFICTHEPMLNGRHYNFVFSSVHLFTVTISVCTHLLWIDIFYLYEFQLKHLYALNYS
jgi:hypothetical protein